MPNEENYLLNNDKNKDHYVDREEPIEDIDTVLKTRVLDDKKSDAMIYKMTRPNRDRANLNKRIFQQGLFEVHRRSHRAKPLGRNLFSKVIFKYVL